MGVQQVLAATALLSAAGAVLAAGAGPATAQPKPPADRPGCYAKMAIAPVYKTVNERVAGAPVTAYRDAPPVTEHYTKRVIAVPARTERQTLPAVYKTVWRWTTAPGIAHTVVLPPVYRMVTEQRLISAAHLEWRPGGVAHGFSPAGGGSESGVEARPTGEVLCRVLVPARYALVRHRQLVSPAHRSTTSGPARRVRVQTRVLVRPARTQERKRPAVYQTEDAVRTLKPARRQRIVIPGAAHTLTRRVLVSPERFAWAQIICSPQPGAAPAPPRPEPAPAPTPSRDLASAPHAARGPSQKPAPNTRRAGRAYRPDDIVAPAPAYPAHMHMPPPPAAAPGMTQTAPAMSMTTQPLTPAPYDVGRPAH